MVGIKVKAIKILCLTSLYWLTGVGRATEHPEVVLDRVEAVLYQNEAPDLGAKDVEDHLIIITQQEVIRRGFDGRDHSLEEVIDEALLACKALSLKVSFSEDDMDRQLEKMGLTVPQQVVLADQNNYADVAEFKDSLQRMYLANMAQGFEIESHLVVLENEVLDYYEKNPVWEEAEYTIQTCFVPLLETDKYIELQNKLQKFVQTGHGYGPRWDDAVTVKMSELSVDNQFLTEMQPGQLYLKPVTGGFDLFKLVSKRERRLQSLADRKSTIIEQIRTARYPQAIAQVQAELRHKSSIHYPVES